MLNLQPIGRFEATAIDILQSGSPQRSVCVPPLHHACGGIRLAHQRESSNSGNLRSSYAKDGAEPHESGRGALNQLGVSPTSTRRPGKRALRCGLPTGTPLET